MYREKELQRITKQDFLSDSEGFISKIKASKKPAIISSDTEDLVVMDYSEFRDLLIWNEEDDFHSNLHSES